MHAYANDIAKLYAGEGLVVLQGDSTRVDEYERAFARIVDNDAPYTVMLYVKSDEPLHRGDLIDAKATVRTPDFETNAYWWNEGSVASLYASSFKRVENQWGIGALQSFRKRALAAIGNDSTERSMIQAIVCGYRHDIRDDTCYSDYQSCGLAHMIAVSGAHLAIVMGIVASALQALGCPRVVRIIVLIMFMGAYLVVAGVPVSAVRACAMSSIALTSYFGKRRASSQNALGIGMVLLIAHDPCTAVSVSFTLSCLSTAGIVLFMPLVSFWLRKTPLARAPFVLDALALTCCAGFGSQLYATASFGLLPVVSPLANVLCAPLLPLVCGVGMIAAIASAVAAPGAGVLTDAASIIVGFLNGLVSQLAAIPYGCIPLTMEPSVALFSSFAICGLLWLGWTSLQVRYVAVASSFVLVVLCIPVVIETYSDEIVMLDVGQGDSFLLRSRGETLLIDTGNQDAKLTAALARHHIIHLDSVLVTHADDDHYGSLDAIDRCVDVTRVLVAHDMLACADDSCRDVVQQSRSTAREIVGVEMNDHFRVGAFECVVVWPKVYEDSGGNADSVCLYVCYDGNDDGTADVTALFTGDAEFDQIAKVLENTGIHDIGILKIGHHGSKNALTLEEAQKLNPRIGLIGVGAHNRYGHPHADTLSILETIGSSVYRSDIHGDVTCALSARGVSVTTMQ